MDRYSGRLVRYLESQLESGRLFEIRRYPYPDAQSLPLDRTYHLAGEGVARTVTARANSRKLGLLVQQAQQRVRMTRYFSDLRAELNKRLEKARARGEETDDVSAPTRGPTGSISLDGAERHRREAPRVDVSDSLRSRLEALDREEALRLKELQDKTMLRMQIILTNVLHVKTPRLFLDARLVFDNARRFP